PEQYALSVALFTNDPGVQNLNNLPSVGGTPGSQGGGWPATIWNEFMQNQMNNLPYVSLPAQVPAGFVPWIQVRTKPKAKKFCKFGGGGNQGGGNKGCVCPPGAPFCGQPNPNPSCNGNGNGNGNCGAPSPSPSCGAFGGFGGTCTSPAP